MLDEKDLQMISDLMDEKINASESKMMAHMDEKIGDSESRMMAMMEAYFGPKFDLLADGIRLIQEKNASQRGTRGFRGPRGLSGGGYKAAYKGN